MSAELGLMRATDQIESLSLMAIDPVAKTVVPRFWAAIIGMPLLCGFFCSFAIVAGYLEAVYVLGLDPGYFRSEEHTSELQSLMRISYAVFCLKKKKQKTQADM